MTTNIGNVIDPFYRYKRPVAIILNKGKSTIIENIKDIAMALHTKESYMLYYIQLEKSIPITSKGAIKANMNKNEIEKIINDYIEKYILCNKCNYPELVTKKDNKKLYFSCNSCGNAIDIVEDKFTKIIYKDYK